MKLPRGLGPLLVIATVTASLAGACSATQGKTFQATGVGGAADGSSGTTNPVSGNGGNGGLSFTSSVGSGNPSDAGPDQGGPPNTTCDNSCMAAGGQCQNGTCTLQENPGGLSPATQTMLTAGGAPNPQFAFVYPYDQTVFPRGLLPPTLQFTSAGIDGAYVHVSFPGMDYKGFYAASQPPRIVFSAPVWKAITLSATGLLDVKVEVTGMLAGQVAGPVTETWRIAKGSLRGTIYYETYNSTILAPAGGLGIMKIQPGAQLPTMVKEGCGNVCHTASADGSTLVSAVSLFGSASWDLKNNAASIYQEGGDGFVYGALVPDGSLLISATGYRTWLSNPSHMYDSKTGVQVAAPGWDGVINQPGTPAFSPDGKKIALNHFDADPTGSTLAVMSYNGASHAFSNLVEIAHDAQSRILAWPAFTPDTTAVVFHAGSNQQFETDNGATGDLYWTDLATHTVTRLDLLDGYKNGQTYLPDSDPNLSFAPTVLPEAVGGYFWVVFTSHRSYGNTLPSMDNGDENGKLWVAAFDIGATPGTDPSHPAFYLDGQEQVADNLRGFWVLDPCQANGTDCASGDECCEGFCQVVDGGGMCAPQMGGCAAEFDKCTTAADCCNPTYRCINGKCAQPPPPQ